MLPESVLTAKLDDDYATSGGGSEPVGLVGDTTVCHAHLPSCSDRQNSEISYRKCDDMVEYVTPMWITDFYLSKRAPLQYGILRPPPQ